MTYPNASTKAGDPPAKGQIKSLRHIFAYLRPYRGAIIGATIALLFTSSAVLSLGAALRFLVDEGIAKGNLALLDDAFIALICVTILLAVATYARYYFVSWVGERVVADIRNDVYGKILSMDTAFFETTRVGDILSRITTDTTLLQNVVGSSISIFLRNALLFIGGTTMLIITSLTLTNYVLIMLPLVIAPIIILGKRVRRLSRATQNRVADLSSHAEETIGAIRTVQAMSLEGFEGKRFGGHVEDARATAIRRIRVRALLTAIVICLVFGAVVMVLWIGGRSVISGDITPGDLSSFIFYSVVVAGALGAVSEVIGELQRAAGAAERLMEMMALEPIIRAPAHPTPLPKQISGLVCFNDVTFRYPSRPDMEALSQFSLTITPGETVALVGPSGAGKTTVFQTLLRFYDPQEGNISLDSVPITELDPKALRSAIGLVPQDPLIFSANAWDNIRCGRPDASDAEVLEAARAAYALDFLEALPDGLDSHLGEKGVRLSGGQKQRLAIARAIIRDPKILLLDEATSALDSESEQFVQKALAPFAKDRTTLIIAHRLSTVMDADRIVVLDNGRIEAIGKHDALIASSPLYARLASLQLS